MVGTKSNTATSAEAAACHSLQKILKTLQPTNLQKEFQKVKSTDLGVTQLLQPPHNTSVVSNTAKEEERYESLSKTFQQKRSLSTSSHHQSILHQLDKQ